MTETRQHRARMLWIIPPIAVGVLVMIFMGGNRQTPVKVDDSETSRVVRTVKVPAVDLTPTAEGYGVVQPARVWTAVAQVAGRVIEMHPRLRDGEIISAGALLFRIDPVDYELSLAQIRSELAELDVQAGNAEDLLAIEQRNLSLAQRESERLAKLAKQGTSSRSQADEAQRAVLSARSSVQNLRNTLALLPSQRGVLEAKLAQAKRDLANTSVQAPFNLRVAGLAMETDQYVSTGQKLFAGDSVDRVEIVAQVAMSALRRLFVGRQDETPNAQQLTDGLADFADLQPTVRMELGDHVAEWPAEFVRFTDNVDSTTRTIGVVVAVDRPFDMVRPGLRPPLSKGMFVNVLLRGREQAGRIVIPRSALREGRVMLVDGQRRLRTQTVETLFTQDDLAIVASGVEAGQQLVVSDLVPAVDGMQLSPQPDTKLQRLLQQAGGATP